LSDQKKTPLVTKAILSIPYVKYLLELVSSLTTKLFDRNKKVEELEAEIRRLKKQPKKPKIEASKLDEKKPGVGKGKGKTGKRAGSEKKKKKKGLEIDRTERLEAKSVPEGWKLIGFKPYVVQDILVERDTIKYEREIWQSPDGNQRMVADLPAHLEGRTFGPKIRGYIIHLYNSCHVTQPLIWQHLRDMGVDISKGQVNFILNGDKANEVFEQELLDVVKQGMDIADEIRTDDTSARHKGNGEYCNCINTDLFTYFKTTDSKSRVNFLKILQLDNPGYELNGVSLSYYKEYDLAPKYLGVLEGARGLILKNDGALAAFFVENNISAAYAKRIITEGLLIGYLVASGFDGEQFIHADDAGQFKIFNHSLCWKHAERPLKKVAIRNDLHQQQWDDKMDEFWQLYQDLKKYKSVSGLAQKRRKAKLEQRFDQLCESVENFEALNLVLEQLKKKKRQLLLVLDYPFVSLHNNDTEREIREYAKRRKISGSTRSENGKKYRDVFTSLKKTCRKLGVSFWEYIMDRIAHKNKIPPLADILILRAQPDLN